jgi:hypothetical protein
MTGDEDVLAYAMAGVTLTAALFDTLVKQGVIDQALAEATIKDAGAYVQALCVDCSPELERSTLRILQVFGKLPEQATSAAARPPIPVVEP